MENLIPEFNESSDEEEYVEIPLENGNVTYVPKKLFEPAVWGM